MSVHFQEDEILGKAYDARLLRRLWRGYGSPDALQSTAG